MKLGDRVTVIPGAMEALRERGFVADYMTESIDGKSGIITEDYRDVPGCPHWSVELGFDKPVGIPEAHLMLTDKHCICPVVTINAVNGHVSEDAQRAVARLLFASVELKTSDPFGHGRVVFGKHRPECPCA